MHFISNPNSFNKLVDNISNTIDNMADKLDPNKNITPTNRELVAQGVGNVFSGRRTTLKYFGLCVIRPGV